MRGRRLTLVAGVFAVATGLVLTLAPGLVAVDLATALSVVVWLVALGGAAIAVYGRFDAPDAVETALPRAGDRPAYGVPGDDLAARVASLGAGERDAAARDRVRERVRETAVAALERFEGASPEATAAHRLADGTWTDDKRAASLFAEGGSSGREGVERGFADRFDRAADALAAVAGIDVGEGGDGEPSPPTAGPPATPRLARGETRLERTGRWRGVSGLALAATAAGILLGQSVAILAGLAGVGFAAYGRAWTAPDPVLAVERTVSETDPAPGDRVRVTLTVVNESDRLLPDLRFCDDVPAGLEVVEGTPRHTTALRPGKRATVAYECEAVRGRHAFDSLTVATRDVSGASVRWRRVPTDESVVTCRPRYDDLGPALGDMATRLTGRQDVAATGEGIAFHSVREYRRDDPVASVDWNRLAKSGDLATRRFDQPRTVRVVLVVDARRSAYATADADERRPAVDASVHAAAALAGGLLDAGSHVGLAALSPRECWLDPAAGATHRRRIRDRLTTDPAFGWLPPEPCESPDDAASDRFAELLVRLPGDAQVVFCSPLVDDAPVDLARQLLARGHDVHVASPAVTATDAPARRFAALERRLRLDAVRRAGATVREWFPCADSQATEADATALRTDESRSEPGPAGRSASTTGGSVSHRPDAAVATDGGGDA